MCTQCHTGYGWLPRLLATFARKHPGVGVNIVADATDHPVEALLDGRVDVAILTSKVKDHRVRVRPLFMDEMVAVVARTHPLAARAWVSPRELALEHLLLYASVPEESFMLTSVLAPAGLVPARVSFIMLTEAMIAMSQAGIGVGILPRWSAEAAIASRAVVALSITRRGVRRQWAAATLRTGHGAIVAQRFHRFDRRPRGTGEAGRPPDGVSMKLIHRFHANNAFVLMASQPLP